jgi:dCMP deaminase
MPIVERWNQHWMKIAQETSKLSKDPSTKVGAVIVTADNRQCSIGYNGFASGVPETEEMWENREIKYRYEPIHAEENALLNCPFDTKGCKLYVTHRPCHKCMPRIINSGITHVIYGVHELKHIDEEVWEFYSENLSILHYNN